MPLNGQNVKVGACIFAGDMNNMVRFYRDTLGLHTSWDDGDFAEFDTASGALSFFMYSRKAFVQAIEESYMPPKGINQTFEVALWLPCFADVDAEYARLSKLDVQFPTGEPQTFSFGIRNFYVADPEGNLLEIGSTNETKG
jgi:lactoylglutathione lyase